MSAPKKAAAPQPKIDETIEIALAAAGTATDAAQEIQRLKKEVDALVGGSRKNGKILMFTGILILVLACGALGGGIVLYNHSLTRFESLSKVNKDALSVFADEINGLTQTAKRIEELTATTAQALAVVQGRGDDLKRSVDLLTSAEKTLIARIEALSASNEKIPAGVKQIVDELVASNKAAIAQITATMSDPAKNAALKDIATKLDAMQQAQRSAPREPVRPPPARRPSEPAPLLRYP